MNGNLDKGYIVQDLGSGPVGVMNHFLNNSDNTSTTECGEYFGKVIDNDDPEKLGRCRILVYGVFDGDIPDEHLPWAIPEFGFVGSLKGSFIVPPIDAIVKVVFEGDEINLPKYSTKVLNINQLPTNKDKNYPHNMVFFETDNGDSFEIDRETSETTFTHKSGTKIVIDPDGNIEMSSEGETVIKHTGNYTLEGGAVTPDPLLEGGLNCIKTCPYSGGIHVGQILSSNAPLGGANGD